MPLSGEKTNDLERLDFFLNLLSLRLFWTLSEDELEAGGKGEGEGRTMSFTDFFTFYVSFQVVYRAVGAMAAVSFATAKATNANGFEAIAV